MQHGWCRWMLTFRFSIAEFMRLTNGFASSAFDRQPVDSLVAELIDADFAVFNLQHEYRFTAGFSVA